MNYQEWQKDQVLGDLKSRELKEAEVNKESFERAVRKAAKRFLKKNPDFSGADSGNVSQLISLAEDVIKSYLKHF